MKKVILLFTISLFFMMGSKGYAQESLENFLVNTTFTWIDNGKTLGTTTFTTDGIAHPTWSDLHHTWKLEANNDLLVSANGTQYVARLKWNSTSKSFSGERDVTSQIQDGVKTVMKEVEESPENFLVNTTFTWIDNGKTLGTTTFTTDGVAHPTWTTLPNIWKLEANNDLLIFTNGTQYVARLKWNSASQSFSGERDVTSQIQDGVKTVMKEVEESPENFLVNTTFTWIDNGKTIGTITFTTDGIAHPTWTDLPNIWKLEANNDLLIFTNGTQYVARLKWNSASQSFSGERDVTSQIQDGVKTVMKKMIESEDYLSKEIKEKGFVNIYGIRFDSSKDIPKSESEATLNELASFLKSNPKLKIEIIGHTDSEGDNKLNEDLSLRRAQSIINWLKSKGVNISNLNASGLGESNPVANNKTESGKALNRRVEIKVIK